MRKVLGANLAQPSPDYNTSKVVFLIGLNKLPDFSSPQYPAAQKKSGLPYEDRILKKSKAD
jgi:hypothetical protein